MDEKPFSAPTLFTVPDVAKRLHKSERWLQAFLRENPFGRRAGRTRLFTEADVAAIIEALPTPAAPAALVVVPSEASQWAKAERLLANGKLERSTRGGRPRARLTKGKA